MGGEVPQARDEEVDVKLKQAAPTPSKHGQ